MKKNPQMKLAKLCSNPFEKEYGYFDKDHGIQRNIMR